MGDRVSGLVRVGGTPTPIVIEITCKAGQLDNQALENFKMELEKLAKSRGLKVRKFKTAKAPKKKAGSKK